MLATGLWGKTKQTYGGRFLEYYHPMLSNTSDFIHWRTERLVTRTVAAILSAEADSLSGKPAVSSPASHAVEPPPRNQLEC